MNLDNVKSVLPWDHTFEFAGATHQTRAPKLGDLVTIERGLRGEAKTGEMMATIQSLVMGATCQVTAWDDEQLGAFMQDYFRFFGEWQRRKAAARMSQATAGTAAEASRSLTRGS